MPQRPFTAVVLMVESVDCSPYKYIYSILNHWRGLSQEMTKKKPRKKSSNINKKRASAIAMSVFVCVVVAGIYIITKPSVKVPPVAPATGLLIETRPVLTDAIFPRISLSWHSKRN